MTTGGGRTAVGSVAAYGAAAALGWKLERRWARRFERPDPAADHVMDVPSSAVHHHLPTGDGGTSYVVAVGEGRPVVLLHGITMQAEAWVYQLNQRHDARLLAVDLRGHGRSRPGRDGASLALCARDLRDLLEGLDLRGAVLVGHSLGGMTIGQFLVDHPGVARDRVAAYGLVATAGRTPVAIPGPLLAVLADRLVRDAEAGGATTARLRRIPRSDLGEWGVRQAFGRDPSRRHVDLVAASFEQLPAPVYASLLSSLFGFDALEAWSSVTDPVAILHGTRDRIIPLREAVRLADAVPGARFQRLSRAGHLLPYERPDAVTAMIAALLGEADAGGRWQQRV